MHWISVTDRLPKDDEHVLVYDDGEGRCVGYHTPKGWWSYPCHDAYDTSLLDVMYWMPLPKPPGLSLEDSKSDS
jgi:hypothetical protein